jgi:hypothetical protein
MKDKLTRALIGLCCVLASMLSVAVSAHASAALEVHAGVSCLRAGLLESQLEPGIAGALEHERIHVLVEGSEQDPRTAVIRLTRDDELLAERTFSPGPPRCPDLHSALAITIGIMVRSILSPAPPQPAEPEPVAEPEPPALPAPAPPPRVRPSLTFTTASPARPVDRAFALHTQGAVGWAIAAELQRGLQLALGLRSGRWSVRAVLLALFSREEKIERLPAHVTTRPLVASLDGCVRLFVTHAAHSHLCAGLLAGRMQMIGRAEGEGRARPPSSDAWSALRAQLELALRLGGPLWLTASVGPVRGLRALRPGVLDSAGQPLPTPPLPRTGLLVGIGLTYEFGRQGSARSEHP